MNHLQTFQVFPAIPKPLEFLEVLSRNLWWSWKQDAVELFRRIDPKLWAESGQNPIVFSTFVPQHRLEELAKDSSFLSHLEFVKENFHERVLVQRVDENFGNTGTIAYFSMEFGIHESLPLFAGGLGILAGDHLKTASNMALPLIGIGLLYRRGYFHQFLDHEGWQQELYPETDLYHLPLEKVRDEAGKALIVSVSGPDGEIRALVWKVSVGRIPLLLLDTNIPENSPAMRDISARLYAVEAKIRLAQEMLLGLGGMRALAAMGIQPTICHMNEGHSAFCSLERLAQIIASYKVDLKTALEIVVRTTVFTTHTPVAAGHDEFPADLILPYLRALEENIDAKAEEILSWGQPAGSGAEGPLSMFILGLHMSVCCNGVSRLHGEVARRMWANVWPGRPIEEIPISHVTNGVHIPSFISYENSLLFERYLGPDWYLKTLHQDTINRIDDIFDEELWRARGMSRSRLIRTCRELMVKQYSRRSASKSMMEEFESVLDPERLTIGFARRFATYKRAALLLHDPDRLEAILTSTHRPVQIIFAGKAHPKDNEGKELIKRIVEFARKTSVRHRLVFLEDYDTHIARHMVQGADIWLNTPRRPFEACGTSGMKAAANGVLNVSVLDGWWCEGYAENRGWRIGNGEEYAHDIAFQDVVESQALYDLLENDVISCFYDRKNGNAPARWIRMMKASMKMAIRDFSSHRMLREYIDRFYLPATKQFHELVRDDARIAKSLRARYERLRSCWDRIRIEAPVRHTDGTFRVGESFRVTAGVYLGELQPEEVDVQLYYGILKSLDSLVISNTQDMAVEESRGNGDYLYGCSITCSGSGRYGFTARVTPRGDDRIKFAPGLITWA